MIISTLNIDASPEIVQFAKAADDALMVSVESAIFVLEEHGVNGLDEMQFEIVLSGLKQALERYTTERNKVAK